MDPFRPAPRFDDTGFQRWKVLMQAHLQATGLNIWRVVSEDVKNNGQQEKQYDVTAKCIILSSLSDNVFNRVYSCANAKELWKTIIENHEGTEDCNEHGTIYAISSDFGDRMTTQSMGLILLLSEHL